MRSFEQQTGANLSPSAERITIGGLPAVRAGGVARTRDGPIGLEITWVALGGKVYRITGMTQPASFEAMRPAFRETAGSFGALTSAERAAIREARIQLVRARGGETLSTLLAQAGSVWSLDYAAVANDLDTTAPLDPRLVKVGVSQPYGTR